MHEWREKKYGETNRTHWGRTGYSPDGLKEIVEGKGNMRLTKKRADNGRYYLSGLVEVSNTYPKGYGRIQVGHAVEKLAEYEDLEEQGKLLKLPCAVGDTVYVIPSKTNYKLNIINGHSENNRVYEQIVNRIEITEKVKKEGARYEKV